MKLPYGITQVIEKDDMRTSRDPVGDTPAKCFRNTGVVWVNKHFWNNLSDDIKCFILGHEAGHIVRDTDNEFEADKHAFEWCMQNGVGLKSTVYALTKVLSYPEEKPKQKAEQEARTRAMVNLALAYDAKYNNNPKAKNMNDYIPTAAEYESHLAGTVSVMPVKEPVKSGSTITPPPSSGTIIQPRPNPYSAPPRPNPYLSPIIVPAQPILGFPNTINTKPEGLTGAQLEYALKNALNSKGEPTVSADEKDKDKDKKIMGMPQTAFYIAIAVAVLIVLVLVIKK